MKLTLNRTIEVEKNSPAFFMNKNKVVMVYEVEGELFYDSYFNIPGEKYWSCVIMNDFFPSEIDGLKECSFSEYQEKIKDFSKTLPI